MQEDEERQDELKFWRYLPPLKLIENVYRLDIKVFDNEREFYEKIFHFCSLARLSCLAATRNPEHRSFLSCLCEILRFFVGAGGRLTLLTITMDAVSSRLYLTYFNGEISRQ